MNAIKPSAMLATITKRAASVKSSRLPMSMRGISSPSSSLSIRGLLRERMFHSQTHKLSVPKQLSGHRQFSMTLARREEVELPDRPPNASASSSSASSPTPDSTPSSPALSDGHVEQSQEPRMAIAFTCTVDGCGHRQAHTFTKRSYEKGIVIITCSSCNNRHLIADHLGWFQNLTGEGTHVTIEKLAKMQGEKITRGSLDANGVLEYSDDKA